MSRVIPSVDVASRAMALSFRVAGYDWSLPVPINADKDRTSTVDLDKQGQEKVAKGGSMPDLTKQFDKESRRVCQMMFTVSVHSTAYPLRGGGGGSSPDSAMPAARKEGKEDRSAGKGPAGKDDGKDDGTEGEEGKQSSKGRGNERERDRERERERGDKALVSEITVYSKAALVDCTGLRLKVTSPPSLPFACSLHRGVAPHTPSCPCTRVRPC